MEFEDYENEDVELVFENVEAQMRQEDRHEHEELLSAFFRDAIRIRHITDDAVVTNPKAGLDRSLLAPEVVGTFPKEWIDLHREALREPRQLSLLDLEDDR